MEPLFDAMQLAMHALGAALLSVAAALLFEELTFGGLARFILAPRPRRAKQMEPQPAAPQPDQAVQQPKPHQAKPQQAKFQGESQCSR